MAAVRGPTVAIILPSILSCLAGCGAPAEPDAAPPGAPAGTTRALEHLKSLGYVSWDDEADASLSGVTRFDEARAWPGVNLFTNDVDRVYLTDMRGRLLHEWRLPPGRKQCEHAEILDDGDLLVECVDQAITRLRPDSTIAWDLALPAHHDVAILTDGSILVPFLENREYRGRQVGFDGIARVSRDGKPSPFWSAWRRFDELRRLHPASPLDTPPLASGDPLAGWEQGFEYYHLNSIEALPATPLGARDPRFREGNLLVCLRNINLMAILDQDDLSVVWSWGAGELELPHMPTMIPDGNILVFDNGTYRGWSRVLEVEPLDGRIVWSYEGSPRESFFSKWRGGVQRLPNGNTLICESDRGHVFEVTPEGEIVWEFWNPEIVDSRRKRIYRFTRLPPAEGGGVPGLLGGRTRHGP